MKIVKCIVKALSIIALLVGVIMAVIYYRDAICGFISELKNKCRSGKLFSCCKCRDASDFEDM